MASELIILNISLTYYGILKGRPEIISSYLAYAQIPTLSRDCKRKQLFAVR